MLATFQTAPMPDDMGKKKIMLRVVKTGMSSYISNQRPRSKIDEYKTKQVKENAKDKMGYT